MLLLPVTILIVFTSCRITADGNVGCFFERDLCEEGEFCSDDGAFGRCQSSEGEEYRHLLDEAAVQLLESELGRLWEAGYRWQHVYSQCVVRNLLASVKHQHLYDPGFCSRTLRMSLPVVSEEIAMELEQMNPGDQAIIKFTPSLGEIAPDFADEVFFPPLSGQEGDEEMGREKKSSSRKEEDILAVLPYLRQLARDTASLLDENADSFDVYPEDDLPVVETDLSSDMTHRPVYTEGGVEWVPVDENAQANDANTVIEEPFELPNSFDDDNTINNNIAATAYGEPPAAVAENMNWDSSNPHRWQEEDDLPLGWKDYSTMEGPLGSPLTDSVDINIRDDPAFRRPMRYDTKKPGPTYFYHNADSAEVPYERDLPMGMTHFSKPKANVDASVDKAKQRNDVTMDEHSRAQAAPVISNSRSALHMPPKGALEEDGMLDQKAVDDSQVYLTVDNKSIQTSEARDLVDTLQQNLKLPKGTFSNVDVDGGQIAFKVNPNSQNLNASFVAAKAAGLSRSGLTVVTAEAGDKAKLDVVNKKSNDRQVFVIGFVACGTAVGVVLAVSVVYLVRRHARSKEKLQSLAQPDTEPSQDYQDLCRQRMAAKTHEKPEPIHVAQSPKRVSSLSQSEPSQPSSRSSTSSWSEEPVTSNMDISTGHMILSYMEDHLKCKDRLDREWEALCAYEADPCSVNSASLPHNMKKNRYPDILPHDHSRVILNDLANISNSDYINANTITDHDPRNPAYIATQGPLPHTAADFWQMIWEQGSVVIVMLSRLMENGVAMCHRYWPEEGSEVYHLYEVHLVSEHIWCDDYLVRSFYLKNLKTGETRTVTQFHFLSWPDNGIPASIKAILEFRRKVNKSYRGRSCPIVVHCSDGIGRTGTYCLIDMVLNRMAKGAKEIDIAATLEHIRDQRAGMVKTKAQFEFVLMAIAEEVHAILKALSH